MEQSLRLYSITTHYEQLGWSAALRDAVTDYLSDAGTLAQVDLAWQDFNDRAPLPYLWRIRILSNGNGPLDTLDLRVLDLFELFGELAVFLYAIPGRNVAPQIADHLRSRGRDEQTIRRSFFPLASRVAFDAASPEQPTATGRYLLTHLPQYAEEMFNAQEQYYNRFFRLLLMVQPPVPELIWQMAQRLEQREQDSYDVGFCATVLLEADSTRYTPWATRLAGPNSPLPNEPSRLAVLDALVHHDPVRHLDLALAAAQLPITDRYASFQCGALRLAYSLDPTRSLPLVEAACVSKHYWLAFDAIRLLQYAPFAQVRPTLQRCVIEGHAVVGFGALQRLLGQPWAGQQAFLLTLLTHHSKRIRERANAALQSQYGLAP